MDSGTSGTNRPIPRWLRSFGGPDHPGEDHEIGTAHAAVIILILLLKQISKLVQIVKRDGEIGMVRLMIGETKRREKESFDGIGIDIDRGLRRVLEAFPGLVRKNVLEPVLQKSAGAIERESNQNHGSAPKNEVVPPFQVKREERDQPGLANEDRDQLHPERGGIGDRLAGGAPFCATQFADDFFGNIVNNTEDQERQATEAGPGFKQRAVDVGIDILIDALRVLVMFEMGLAIVEERNAHQRGMENAKKFVQPNREKEVFVGGLVGGHDEAVLHEPEEEKAENVGERVRVVLQEPEVGRDKDIRRNDMHGGMSIPLILAKLRDLLPEIHIVF